MSRMILTEVSATVDSGRESDLVVGFRDLARSPVPDGLVRTELLQGPEGRWRIQTLWRSREALNAMLAGSETPTARRLFERAGADSSLQILEVEAEHHVP